MSLPQQMPRPINKLSPNIARIVPISVAFVAIILAGPLLIGTPEGQRGLLALTVAGLLICLVTYSPATGIPAVIIYLGFQGGLRRWLVPILGLPTLDPLLLIAPAIATVYWVNLTLQRRINRDTKLARLIFWLLGLMMLEVFNPLQGGLQIGLMGMLFWIVPVFWYYIGRRLGSTALLDKLFWVIIVIALLGAIYGLYQTFFGFTDSEMLWIKSVAKSGLILGVGGGMRAFSFFGAPSEYCEVVSVGIILCVVYAVRGNRSFLILLPVMAWALFLATGRGPIVTTLAVCATLWAVQGKAINSWGPRAIVAIIIAFAGLFWTMTEIQTNTYDAKISGLIEHQTQGLTDPLNPDKSTASIHSSMIFTGVLEGFSNPLGRGLGSTTIANAKSGSAGWSDTESDWGDSFIALGLPGGLLFNGVKIMVFILALRLWRQTRSTVSLGAFAILLATYNHWCSVSHYFTFTLAWFLIGAIDSLQKKSLQPPVAVTTVLTGGSIQNASV